MGGRMPKGPKGERRPADAIANAVRVMQIATGEAAEEFEAGDGKDKAAQALGRKGGAARAADMRWSGGQRSPRRRRRNGGDARTHSGAHIFGLLWKIAGASCRCISGSYPPNAAAPSHLIPWFDGAILSREWKEALWGRFVTGAPRPRSPSEQQCSDRKMRGQPVLCPPMTSPPDVRVRPEERTGR
jgi:hypothetical protein